MYAETAAVAAKSPDFIMSRVLDAPREQVCFKSKIDLRPDPLSACADLADRTAHGRDLREHPGGKTKLTIRCSPINPTMGEQQTFDAGHDSMRQSWGGSPDKLSVYLARAR